MLRRIPALIRPRPFSGLPLSSGNWDVSVAVCVPPTARSGTGRTENNIQRHFGTGSCIYSKKDSQSVPANEISQKTAETQGDREETQKKNLLDILKDMKVELSTVNVQTTKPRGKRPSAGLQAAVSRHRRAPEDPPKNRNEFLSSELVAAASAVADSLPWDKQTTKSELLRQLQQHEEETRTQKDREKKASPSLWEIEFAKQLATVNEQPLGNGFEEMIQWTKEGKLWEFPVNNEAGFDDDGSEFHDHIFLDKHLEGFPKQGPIRIFMELVTSGLSKNPYLSVKQKVDHIEWFRNYFNEKQDILKENKVEFT
ncbi:28S ribosomal protein S31, mitochondrial [Cricetulus griseus]|uniref:Small ribosomal subunit protein mS31 n=1 Tax=Cricetulus griseus TaxID=10029 RepID=G3HHK0_CRIGR|nr:28S ribosomal protein S31, mitochondrial [Cricetulus griseus]ERE88734.1 28S ribosomal protein S31 [Cricetulus griseus]